MKISYDNLIHTFLSLFFPRYCAGCGLENEIFCGKCLLSSYKEGSQCLICGFRNKDGKICQGCLKKTGFRLKQVFWTGHYDVVLREAIRQLKYKKRRELAKPLAELLWKKFNENDLSAQHFSLNELSARGLQDLAQTDGASRAIPQQRDMRVLQTTITRAVIIPIPLHFKKEYERGFNQAELLAREFGKLSGIQCLANALIKTKETLAQVEVENKELRIKNLENAFQVNPKISESDSWFLASAATILLIDDVATTGATLSHAASALEKISLLGNKAGAKKIIGLVLAHGG